MSALERVNELYLKHDGRVPQDELKAALGSKVLKWADARFWQEYYEERLMLNWGFIEEANDRDLPDLLKKHDFFIQQAKEWRATAKALDWQRTSAIAAE